jgi:hypothetical protein
LPDLPAGGVRLSYRVVLGRNGRPPPLDPSAGGDSVSRVLAVSIAVTLLFASCSGGGAEPRQEGSASPLHSSPGERKPPCTGLASLVRRVQRGYVPRASPDISVIPREPNYVGTARMPVHSGPWDYLARVPLLLYGPGLVRADVRPSSPATMADLAPTTAELIDYEGFPRRDGRVLNDALVAQADPPRLVVTLVWDGGGWNVLRRHGDSWPFLRSLMDRGTLYRNFEIGSSPSVTPPIHTTLGTGAFPDRHGIPGLRIRTPGGEYVDSFLALDPSAVRIPTLADLYDRDRGNLPVTGMLASVNWHLGMLGHGRGTRGGDADPALLLNRQEEITGNPTLFSIPQLGSSTALDGAVRRVDASDGAIDGEWMGHTLDDSAVLHSSPAHVAYQQHILERFIEYERMGADRVSDLLYVNFKSSDGAGHQWGMTSKETAAAISAQDAALRRLVSFLDRGIGTGRWVLMLTADHGQTRYPEESGAWPIQGSELKRDVNAALDNTDNGIDLIDRVSSPGAYVNRPELARNGISLREVARWIVGYSVGENLKEGEQMPKSFRGREDERLFDAVLAGPRLAAMSCRR